MLWPRGISDGAVGFNPYRYFPGATRLPPNVAAGDRMNATFTFPDTASIPDGYSARVMPRIGGGMSSWQARFDITGTGALLQGGPMDGAGAITFTAAPGNLSLVVSMAGDGSISIVGDGNLAMTIGMDGAGAISLAGAGGLSMIVPMDGTGAFGLTGAGDVKGDLSLSGSWGGAEPLSPQGLAAAVWGALAAQNNTASTMGALLNASGAAGDPWAVTLDGSYTAAELIRLMAAALAGEISGAGTTTVTIRDVSDTTDRIIATVDGQGNRTALTYDAG